MGDGYDTTGGTVVDMGMIRAALALFADPANTVELRALPSKRSKVRVGTDIEGLAVQAAFLARGAGENVYFGMNPRTIPDREDRAASAEDVACRRWLGVDCDADRPADTSSTEGELACAGALADRATAEAKAAGWGDPVRVLSGNGFHLYWRADLPNDAASHELVRSVLAAFATLDGCGAHVDRKICDAPRIMRLPGTYARKGEDTPERPHRMARIVSEPDDVTEALTEDMLRAFADARKPPEAPRPAYRPPDRGAQDTRLKAYMDAAAKAVCGGVALAPGGERNDILNKAAFRLGRFVAAGVFDEGDAIQLLTDAAEGAGLDDKEIPATIQSGLRGGKKDPWTIPAALLDPPATPRPSPQPPGGNPSSGPAPGQPMGFAAREAFEDDGSETATLADVALQVAAVRWLWQGWIQRGAIVVLASEPGVGKTRLVMDLIRRVHNGLPWPDGQMIPDDARDGVIYLASDAQHAELVSIAATFGIDPSVVMVNAPPREPFAGTDIDNAGTKAALIARVERLKPALVVIDTINHAWGGNLGKSEDIKQITEILMPMALRYGTTFLLVTHLNAAGKTLGRRLDGVARQVVRLERPDPEDQPFRRRLAVTKSNSMSPPPLGVTMGTNGNEYDNRPPVAPESDEPGRGGYSRGGSNGGQGAGQSSGGGSKIQAVVNWLRERLADGEYHSLKELCDEGKDEYGFLRSQISEAQKRMGIEAGRLEGRAGLWWRLADSGDDEDGFAPIPFSKDV